MLSDDYFHHFAESNAVIELLLRMLKKKEGREGEVGKSLMLLLCIQLVKVKGWLVEKIDFYLISCAGMLVDAQLPAAF